MYTQQATVALTVRLEPRTAETLQRASERAKVTRAQLVKSILDRHAASYEADHG